MLICTRSEAETEAAGESIAKMLVPGSVVLLFGALGAGKTAFVRGALRGLGYEGRVTSPTYALVNEYDSDPAVFHFDLYRLGSEEELWDIGFDDYVKSGGILFIEWGEIAEGLLPAGTRRVFLEVKNENERIIRMEEP